MGVQTKLNPFAWEACLERKANEMKGTFWNMPGFGYP